MAVRQTLRKIMVSHNIDTDGLRAELDRNDLEIDAICHGMKGYKEMSDRELKKNLDKAKQTNYTPDAELLNMNNHQDMSDDELEEAVEIAWQRLEAEKLGIEGYEQMTNDEWRDEFEDQLAEYHNCMRKGFNVEFCGHIRDELEEKLGKCSKCKQDLK